MGPDRARRPARRIAPRRSDPPSAIFHPPSVISCPVPRRPCVPHARGIPWITAERTSFGDLDSARRCAAGGSDDHLAPPPPVRDRPPGVPPGRLLGLPGDGAARPPG